MQGMQGGAPKSWLSLSRSMKSSVTVVVLGVIGLLAIMQWTARTVIKHVTVASQSLFSAALMSRRADTAFQRMNREYRDAAVLQERASLEAAARDAAAVGSSLDSAGKSLLKRFHRLPLLLIVLQGKTTVGADKVTLVAPKR